jgi:hypothetical protein
MLLKKEYFSKALAGIYNICVPRMAVAGGPHPKDYIPT